MAEDNQEGKERNSLSDIKYHVPPDLEYVYRDIFNIYAGTGDVVIEFGNHHRSMPEHAGISNRIVVSVGNAYLLMQTLQQALQGAQAALQHGLQNSKGE
ncbi:MAG: hypothetical protein GY710_09945 [Desulfobacteraceae bacterium]|nr:hypothetical protein [Desulfobacteraceae bacterium]